MNGIRISNEVLDQIIKKKKVSNADITLFKQTYEKALSNFYCAVFIDIDGTLIQNHDSEPEDKIVNSIASLVERKVIVCFITGRGRTDARTILSMLAKRIIDKNSSVTWEDLSRWHCITHGGVRALRTLAKNKQGFLADDISLVGDALQKSFDQYSLNIYNSIFEEFAKLDGDEFKKENEKANPLPSADLVNKQSSKITITTEPTSIRVVTAISPGNETLLDDALSKKFYQILQKICNKYKETIPELHLIIGVYKNNIVFEFTIANKDLATKEYNKKYIGVLENRILRIADNGDKNEIDYDFLKNSFGFSVNTVSDVSDSCFPVINFQEEQQSILTGTTGTSYLLDKLTIYPSISMNLVAEKEYKEKLIEIEEKANLGSQKIMNFYSCRMNWIDFLDLEYPQMRLHNVFDYKSGAVFFSDVEWEKLDSTSAFFDMFTAKSKVSSNTETMLQHTNRPNLKYFMHTDKGVIFRGLDIYYYFLYKTKVENSKIEPNKDNTDMVSVTSEMVENWEENVRNFVGLFCNCLDNIVERKLRLAKNDRKFIIGSLDNIRNCLLLMINYHIVSGYAGNQNSRTKDDYDELIFFQENKKNRKNANIRLRVELLEKILSYMYELIFSTEINLTLIQDISKSANDDKIFSFEHKQSDSNLKDAFRNWRETDFIVENFAAAEMFLLQKYEKHNKEQFCFWGLPYGSVELPIIAKILCAKYEYTSEIGYIALRGNYESRHGQDIEANCKYYPELRDIYKDRNVNHVIFDDNITTARTLELAIQCLAQNHIYVNNMILVRYLSLNRAEHILGNQAVENSSLNASAPRLELFFNMIKGLVRPSPYSKLFKFGLMGEKKKYEDELNIFDKSKNRIINCLIKNYGVKKDGE